jgi:tight adherence protein B
MVVWFWMGAVVIVAVGLHRYRNRWTPARLRPLRYSKRGRPLVRSWPRPWPSRAGGDDLAEVVERMAASLRSGRAMPVALAEARGGAEPRLGRHLDLVLAELAAGASFASALEAWGGRDGDRDVQLVVVALVVGMEVGGQRARVLEEVAEALRERRALQREADRQATAARLSAWVVALAPVGFAAVAFLSNPAAARFLLASPAGWVCLAAGLALDGLGAWWMRILGRRATWSS